MGRSGSPLHPKLLTLPVACEQAHLYREPAKRGKVWVKRGKVSSLYLAPFFSPALGRGSPSKQVSLLAGYPTSPTHEHFVLSPVSLASKDQDGAQSNVLNDRHLRSHGKIGDCEQFRKRLFSRIHRIHTSLIKDWISFVNS